MTIDFLKARRIITRLYDDIERDMGYSPSRRRTLRNSEEASGYQRILVQLDRSEQAESALPLACKLARLNHAEIALLRVAEYPYEVSSKCNSQTLVDRGLAEKIGAEIEACCSEKGKRCYSQPTCRRASRHSLAGQTAKSTKTPDPSVTVQWVW